MKLMSDEEMKKARVKMYELEQAKIQLKRIAAFRVKRIRMEGYDDGFIGVEFDKEDIVVLKNMAVNSLERIIKGLEEYIHKL